MKRVDTHGHSGRVVSRVLFAAVLGAAVMSAEAEERPAGEAPPATPVRPVVDTLHGAEVADPYRWLEGSDAPEVEGEDEALDVEVAGWTDRQNAHTRARLDGLPGRAALEARLKELFEVDSIGTPRARGDRYFNTERRGDEAQSVLYVREGLKGEPRRLVDPNALDPEGLTTLAWFEPSLDGGRVAFGLYRSGDENATLYLLETGTGEWLADEIPGKVRGVGWLPDGSGFIYRRLADLENPYSGQIKFHPIGRHHRFDPVLFEQYKDGPLATTWGPYAYSNDEARWMVLAYYTSTVANDLWCYDLRAYLERGELVRRDIVTGEDASFGGPVVGDTLLMETTLDAPRGRVVAVDLNRPGREHWKEFIPEHPEAVIRSLDVALGRIAVTYLENAHTRIALFGMDGSAQGDLPLPGIGSAGLSTRPERGDAFLTYTSYNEPRSIYHVDLATGERTLWARPEIPVDPSVAVVEQAFFKSADGTRVPLFIVRPKHLEKDGDNPTILYGYGGFNAALTPHFRSTLFPWLEAGGVYAVANLRGGGEFGEAWHRAGMLESKQNVFDDFIGAAEWLIENRYTRPGRLAVSGGSNGGLLTGAALVQRPELFRAVVSDVPLLDMLRYQHFLMARYWVPEYGSAEDAGQFAYLRRYSPYHNVVAGTAYPACFFTAGENDSRVHPLHARKMAARVQAATTSDPADRPVLLWVERDTGHGGGQPLEMRIRRSADHWGFLASQLGVKWEVPSEGAKGK